MTCSPAPRSIQEGLDWFLNHNPSSSGMCSQHTWHSLGGDRGCPPAWGCANANQVYDKVKASGRYWTTPRKGDIALWKYGNNGHAARVYDDAGTQIATTDPSNGKMVGVEPIGYPSKWGASTSARIFTDTYNGVKCFESAPSIEHGPVYLDKLVYGQRDSDSVKRLQLHLNGHSLEPPGHIMLPITGNFLQDTETVVRADQDQHFSGADPVGYTFVGPQQAAHLFTGCACEIIETAGTPPPETESPPVSDDYWYSGKPSGTLIVGDSYKKLDVDKWAPKADGLIMSMLYLNVSGEGEFKVRLCRDPDDYTAYQTYYAKAGDSFLLTHVWFEMAEANRKLWWEIGCADSGYTLELGTRYAKFARLAQP